MKNSILLFSFLVCCFISKAQNTQLDILNGNYNACSTDLYVVAYVFDQSYNIVGITNPIPYPSSNGACCYNYTNISGTVGWYLDPGTDDCVMNPWFFGGVDVFNCNHSWSYPSSGTPGSSSCTFYDLVQVGDPNCMPPYNNASGCLEYSSSCSCSASTILTFDFAAVNCGGASFVNIR